MADDANGTLSNSSFVVRCRGLPWSAQKEDVRRFFYDSQVEQIVFGKDNTGRASGEAFVAVATEEDLEKALTHHNEHMTKRYIEVYKSSSDEYEWFLSRNTRAQAPRDAVVHVRGLPYGCVEADLEDFFKDFSIGSNGLLLMKDSLGRTAGDAYIQFSTPSEALNAIQKKHMKKMGHRYLELFPSSMDHAQRAINLQEDKNMFGGGDTFSGRRGRGGPMRSHQAGGRNAPYARPGMHGGEGLGGGGSGGYDFQPSRFPQPLMNIGFNNMSPMGFGRAGFGGFGGFNRNSSQGFGRQQGFGGNSDAGGDFQSRSGGMMNRQGFGMSGGGHGGSTVVHMRGLPYSASINDIYAFFGDTSPSDVEIGYKNNGQATGEADVCFPSHEMAMKAMAKNGENIGNRYIELFLK